VQYGIILTSGDAADTASLAQDAEKAGWDAVFTFEPVYGINAWVALTAAAMTTTTIKLGTMLTPLPRWKPWDLASVTGTLDRLSRGRVILGVGLGAVTQAWTAFEPDEGRTKRAELMDEGLDVLFGLWAGQPFSYDGKHYKVRPPDHFAPPPIVAEPRITTWCAGLAGAAKSMRRAARCDGLLPNFRQPDGTAGTGEFQKWADIIVEITAIRADLGLTGEYDVVAEGVQDLTNTAKTVAEARRYAEIGATWWLDADWFAAPTDDPVATQRERVLVGPPR
jgi:alkanesulfonate monooxygenase SsuD/methylene tetrahydromethanopterin reductase-like flavin-dependent oxidoreductase (luciferase family)